MADSSTNFFSVGSPVKVNGISSTVIAVTIREGFVGYQIAWWNKNGNRVVDNFSPCEVESVAGSRYGTISASSSPSKCLCPGSLARANGVAGRIITVTIRESHVGYQMAIWDKFDNRAVLDLSACEIEILKESKCAVVSQS